MEPTRPEEDEEDIRERLATVDEDMKVSPPAREDVLAIRAKLQQPQPR